MAMRAQITRINRSAERETLMNVILLRVGIDTGSGGILGPVFADNTFEFIPMSDGLGADSRTYGNTAGRYGQLLAEYFPVGQRRQRAQAQPMHVDPEFTTYTYGDPTRPKARLRELQPGDLLVFYAGLTGYGCNYPPALYIVGYFEVEIAGLATQFSQDTIARLFAANFHVMHPHTFATQRDHLVLVKGAPTSSLLDRAVKISEVGTDKAGKPLYVLSHEMRAIFGDFDGKVAIQRSPPRRVAPQHVARAAAFVRSL